MDRTARILTGWVVGCLIAGGVLIVANVPVGPEVWDEQRTLLVRLGLTVIVLGVVGIVAEVMVLIASLRRQGPTPQAPVGPAHADDLDADPRIAAYEQRLEQDRLDNIRVQMLGLRDRAWELHRAFEAGDAGTELPNGAPLVDAWERSVRRLMSEWPAELELFDRRPASGDLVEASDVQQVATYLRIKVERLQEFLARRFGM